MHFPVFHWSGVATWTSYFGPLASFDDELPGGLHFGTRKKTAILVCLDCKMVQIQCLNVST